MMPADRLAADAQRIGDLGGRELVHLEHGDDQALSWRKRVKCRGKTLANLQALRHLERTGAARGELALFRLRGPQCPSFPRVQSRVDEQTVKPGRERAGRVEGRDPVQCPHERFLHQILGVLDIAEKPPRDRGRPREVASHQRVIRRPVTMLGTFDQLGYRYEFDSFAPADHLTLAINDQYQPAADFLGTTQVNRNPSHVTYVVNPTMDFPEMGGCSSS